MRVALLFTSFFVRDTSEKMLLVQIPPVRCHFVKQTGRFHMQNTQANYPFRIWHAKGWHPHKYQREIWINFGFFKEAVEILF
jgi:hypothetical protein